MVSIAFGVQDCNLAIKDMITIALPTLKTSSRVHILVPWNSIVGAKNFRSMLASGVQVGNALVVFLPVNRG